jgi:Pyridoxamine 5''-phosphate oxidase.
MTLQSDELPPDAYAALRADAGVEGPIVIVATVDADGGPHTAPFGSLRALDTRRLRFGCGREHQTYANVIRDGRVVVSVLAPPKVAISIRGRARVVKAQMQILDTDAVIEIAVEEVKDDSDVGTEFEFASGVTVNYPDELVPVVEGYVLEVEQE